MGFPQCHSLLSVIHHGPSWAAWGRLPHDDLLHRLQWNLSTWSSSFPSFLPGLVVCMLTHILTLLWPLSFLCHNPFFPLLKYVITKALLPSLMGLTLASFGSVLKHLALAVRHGSHSAKLPQLVPLAKPGHENPIHNKMRIHNFVFRKA